MDLDRIEFVENPEPRCPVVLLLDTSGSMSGDPITQLNSGIETFKREVQQDATASLRVEVEIITFNSSVDIIQEFVTIDGFLPPKLKVSGETKMGQGIELALNELEKRKSIYRSEGIQYYRPWIFLITDGSPTDMWEQASHRIKQAVTDGKLCFFLIGVKGANMDILRQIAHPSTPPVMLTGVKFQELFRWLSNSMKRVSSNKVGQQVELPPIDEWAGWGQVNT